MQKITIQGHWLIVLAAMLWGTTGTAQAFAPDGAEPTTVGALRLLIGGATLLFVARSQHAFQHSQGKWHPLATVVAISAVAAYQICFFAGVDRAGVAIGTIVGIGSAPIMGGVLGYVIRGEKLDRIWMIATALAIIGCISLTLSGASTNESVDVLGIMLSLGAGLSYAIYTVATKTLLESHAPVAVMAVVFCAGAVLLLPLLFMNDVTWVTKPNGFIVALHLGVIATGLSYILFGRGLRTVTTGTATTLSLSEPLTAGLLGVVILGESLTLIALIGIVLLFAGLGLLAFKPTQAIDNPKAMLSVDEAIG